jgi:hypothetical protein
MASTSQLLELLNNVDGMLATPSPEAAKTLVSNALRTLEMTPSQLAIALDVSPASISRWTNGQTVPHARLLRAMQELVRLKIQEHSEPNGIQLHGRNIGIFGLDSFFRRAREAKNVYVLKNLLPFQAGVNPAVKQQLRNLFAANNELRICYGYPKDSEAAMTFLSFKRDVGSEWPMNIYWKEVDCDHELMQSLGSIFASPFIIEQRDGAIDVLLEVPVRILRGLDDYDQSSYMSLFAELSDTHKYRLWSHWKPILEQIAWDSTPVKIRVEKNLRAEILEVRDRAYDFGTSGSDDFDTESFYVVAEIEGRVVGAIRLTDSQKASPLQHWAQDHSPLPRGEGIVELTRGVVDPGKRNLGIYKWMMVRAMRHALGAGFCVATAAVEEGYYLKEFLHELGFEDTGKLVKYNDAPRAGTLSQSMVCELARNQKRWDTVEAKLEERRKQRGVKILMA